MTQLIDISRRRRAAKFTKTRKIPRNSVEILSNTCLYKLSFSQLMGLFTCRKLVNLSWNLGTETCKQRPETSKLPGVGYVAKNWALAIMLKALPLVHFWSILLLKEQRMTSVRKTFKTLVWSAQNRLISSEICLENNHKMGRFLPIAFRRSLPQKLPWNRPIFPRICPSKSREIWLFRPRPIKSPAKKEGCTNFCPPKNENVPQNFSQGDKLSPSDQILAQTLQMIKP